MSDRPRQLQSLFQLSDEVGMCAWQFFLMFMLLFGFSMPAYAVFYECRGPDGQITFQDHPCASGMESRERKAPEPLTIDSRHDSETSSHLTERPLQDLIQAPAPVPNSRRYVLDQENIDSEEWQETLAQARKLYTHGTLIRIYLEGATSHDILQASASKLANPRSKQGGGRFQEFPSGTFLLVEHLPGSAAVGREAIEVGHRAHGSSKIWLPVAPENTVAAGGNLIMGRMAEHQMSDLWVFLPPGYRKGPMAIGPLVAGERYGEKAPCELHNGLCKMADLAPGQYQIQFPKLDARRARFEVDLSPGERLEVHLRPGGPKVLQIVDLQRKPRRP